MKLKIALLQLLPAGSLEENLEMGLEACREAKKRAADIALFPEMWSVGYPAPHPDCNGHSTLFDGVVYIPDMPGSRDTCVFEAGEEEGIYIAELDMDLLRSYRKREVWGSKNRRPELYGSICSQGQL